MTKRLLRGRSWASAGLVLAAASMLTPQVALAQPASEAAAAVEPLSRSTDPWEGYNRAMFGFNESVDEAVLKPVAQGYRKVVPELVRTGVDNVFGNIGDVWSAVNHLLQGKVMSAGAMSLRVASNTVFGLGGLLDPATEMGLERQSEDLGQTLGRWGVAPGPYVVLPLLGPSTLRDALATPVDKMAGPSALVDETSTALAITALQVVSTRAGLLSASSMLDSIALDKYTFLRDAYLARRRNQVYDGNPPEEDR